MADIQFADDPLINAIYKNIKRGIQVTYDNKCFPSCLVLIYCGIDAMSYLDMPPKQTDVKPYDFIQWAERYLSPNLRNKATQITGEELYSARCALIHTYGVESLKTKCGSARAILYNFGGAQSIAFDATVAPACVVLELETLRGAFFRAIDKYLMEAYADKQKQPILETRLRKLLNTIPLRRAPEGTKIE